MDHPPPNNLKIRRCNVEKQKTRVMRYNFERCLVIKCKTVKRLKERDPAAALPLPSTAVLAFVTTTKYV